MLSFAIDKSMLKSFMSKLIKEDSFDFFEVRTVEIHALARFTINGTLDKDFLPDNGSENEERAYCVWKEIRPHVFNIIKGDKRPKSMKIILSLPQGEVRQMHSNAAAYFLNVYFESNEAYCTVAAAEKVFSMDKTIDVKWEEYVKEFMSKIGIIMKIN